jgi:transcriptional regulator with XRE-family HTH domain
LLTARTDNAAMAISAYLQSPAADAGSRRKPRRKLQLDVPAAHAGGEGLVVTIHNISQSGMLIECDAGLAVDDKIDVELPHAGVVTARLLWASGSLFGCEFKSPISPAAVSAAELRGLATPVSTPEAPTPSGTSEVHNPALRFGANLKRLRIARGLSQAAVAAEMDVSAPSISGWEKGRARPKPDRMTALAALLGVPVTQLLVDLASEPYDDLIVQGRDRIARATGASPDKIRIFIEI